MLNDKKEYVVHNGLVSVPPPIPKINHLSGDIRTHAGSILNKTGTLDKILPCISLNGSSIMNITQGETYIERGANWTDDLDGSGAVSTISGSVNTAVVGTYTITYSKTNISGNTVNTTRIINVTVAPDNLY